MSAAAAMVVQAIKASGVVVRVEPEDFRMILQMNPEPLVVGAMGGFFNTKYKYLTSYKGLAFFTISPEPIELPPAAEVVRAKSIWTPA